MKVIKDLALIKLEIKALKQQNQSIALIPTMGNLHKGHMALVTEGKKKAQKTIVTIFVNPMQFNNSNDLENYPYTPDADYQQLENEGVDIVFSPSVDAMYPNGLDVQTFVEVPNLSNCLEGKLRPGHFRGMSTIVCKLFNIIQPDFACFGEKDFQQLAIIKQMVNDLEMPIEIISVATVREKNGLAMSSRNSKLTIQELEKAPLLAKVMNQLATKVAEQITEQEMLIAWATKTLNDAGFISDEMHIIDAETLGPLSDKSKKMAVLMATFLGDTRLIDNSVINL